MHGANSIQYTADLANSVEVLVVRLLISLYYGERQGNQADEDWVWADSAQADLITALTPVVDKICVGAAPFDSANEHHTSLCDAILLEMEVALFPNPLRPGIGLRPRREAQRPLLPQHARHCPVLEAGSSAGFLVHPPLAEKESFQVGYEGEGRYQLVYSVNTKGSKWDPIFTVTYQLPIGGLGASKREIKMHIQDTPQTREIAHLMPSMFISEDDLGTPAGAVTLRGAWNFQTPQGWDTVYTPVFNMIERPIAPMLAIRVETDWYVHDSEFRYVLQPGEAISASHSMPVGQVMFVPREDITFRDGTKEEIAARVESFREFYDEKSKTKVKTPYGLEYSPHYLSTSRRKRAANNPPGADPAGDPTA